MARYVQDYSPVVSLCLCTLTHSAKLCPQDVQLQGRQGPCQTSVCIMQGSQSRSASLKQVEEEGLLKAGEAGSSVLSSHWKQTSPRSKELHLGTAREIHSSALCQQHWSTEQLLIASVLIDLLMHHSYDCVQHVPQECLCVLYALVSRLQSMSRYP